MRPALGDGLASNNLVAHCSTSKTPITVSTVSNCDFLREFRQESNTQRSKCYTVVRLAQKIFLGKHENFKNAHTETNYSTKDCAPNYEPTKVFLYHILNNDLHYFGCHFI